MNGVQGVFEFGSKGIRVRVESTELGIEKIGSDGEAKDAEFVKEETFTLNPTSFRRNISKETFKKKIMRKISKTHKASNMGHMNVVDIPMFAVNKGNNLGKEKNIRKAESLDKTEFSQKINGRVTTAELE